jgi:hypothetical protein
VISEDRQFALQLRDIAVAVPDVRVLGDDAKGLLLAGASDEDRDPPGWVGG